MWLKRVKDAYKIFVYVVAYYCLVVLLVLLILKMFFAGGLVIGSVTVSPLVVLVLVGLTGWGVYSYRRGRVGRWLVKNPELSSEYAGCMVKSNEAYMLWRRDVTPDLFAEFLDADLSVVSALRVVKKRRTIEDVKRWAHHGVVPADPNGVDILVRYTKRESELFRLVEEFESGHVADVLLTHKVSLETAQNWRAAGLDFKRLKTVELAARGFPVEKVVELSRIKNAKQNMQDEWLEPFLTMKMPPSAVQRWVDLATHYDSFNAWDIKKIQRKGCTVEDAKNYTRVLVASKPFWPDRYKYMDFHFRDIAACMKNGFDPHQVSRVLCQDPKLVYFMERDFRDAKSYRVPAQEFFEWELVMKSEPRIVTSWKDVAKWRKKVGNDAYHYAVAGMTLEEAKKSAARGELEQVKLLTALRL